MSAPAEQPRGMTDAIPANGSRRLRQRGSRSTWLCFLAAALVVGSQLMPRPLSPLVNTFGTGEQFWAWFLSGEWECGWPEPYLKPSLAPGLSSGASSRWSVNLGVAQLDCRALELDTAAALLAWGLVVACGYALIQRPRTADRARRGFWSKRWVPRVFIGAAAVVAWFVYIHGLAEKPFYRVGTIAWTGVAGPGTVAVDISAGRVTLMLTGKTRVMDGRGWMRRPASPAALQVGQTVEIRGVPNSFLITTWPPQIPSFQEIVIIASPTK